MQTQANAEDRPLVKTSMPGIYKRGNRYIVRYRDPRGKQKKAFRPVDCDVRWTDGTWHSPGDAGRVPRGAGS
jgi:hypothetical protein